LASRVARHRSFAAFELLQPLVHEIESVDEVVEHLGMLRDRVLHGVDSLLQLRHRLHRRKQVIYEGDATNQETRLSNRSASAAISFERSRIFAVISATVLRSARILAASRACDAPGVDDANFFAADLAALPFPGLWRMASIRFILSAPILPGKRAQKSITPRLMA
jgi:hypothetical protein